MSRSALAFGGLLALGLLLTGGVLAKDETGRAEITVVAKATRKAVRCRVHLKDAKGKGVKADKLPFWYDHFVCKGEVALDLSPGEYTVEIEHGPEYSLATDSFTLEAGRTKKLGVELKRLVGLPAEGRWPGDTRVP